VSDEFTVPLCREHHQALHRHGNEIAWWANVNVAPLEVAKSLWERPQTGDGNVVLERLSSEHCGRPTHQLEK
jgi:precorrin-6B methylase 1